MINGCAQWNVGNKSSCSSRSVTISDASANKIVPWLHHCAAVRSMESIEWQLQQAGTTANRQQQIGSRSSVYTEQQHIASGSQLDLALDTEPMYIGSGIFSEPQPAGSSTVAPADHGDTMLYYNLL